jgi:hypothetical protein
MEALSAEKEKEAEGEEKIYCKCSLVLVHKGVTILV